MADKFTQMSPIKSTLSKKSSESTELTLSSISTSKKTNSSSDYQPSGIDDLILEEEFENKRLALAMTNYFIDSEPNFYLRIPIDWMWIINKLSESLDIPVDCIKLTFMKIKLNDQFKRLGHQFGYCTSNAARIFRRTVPKIAELLKTLMYIPSKEAVRSLLPIPFRANFSKVFAIIDCFEIQIQNPSNALHQSLSWSEYKHCNTIKYLLCITPDGLVIFVSEGYAGRVSDIKLFETSGIMDILPKDCWLMADRGFKSIDALLKTKNIQLVRPPSVKSTEKPSKSDVLLTKRIASIRIHVERSVRRFREFKLLVPHSTLDHTLMNNSLIDDVIKITSGVINLQQPLIRT